ncbi:CBS domain-containing protein [Aestuariirhabdus litorea]|nr:CBS domain-containing protein [Aestuariirhabdus litorea]
MERAIQAIIQQPVVCVGADDSIESVQQTLDKNRLHCVPVLDAQGGCFGVISAQDLVHFHVLNKNAKAERAWEACSHKVIEVASGASVREVAELMMAHHIHHVLIMEAGDILGIVSSVDIIRHCFDCMNL